MKPQATRHTQRQLAYMAYWQARGYQFGRDEAIPESTSIMPRKWDQPRPIELVVTAAVLIGMGICQYIFAA